MHTNLTQVLDSSKWDEIEASGEESDDDMGFALFDDAMDTSRKVNAMDTRGEVCDQWSLVVEEPEPEELEKEEGGFDDSFESFSSDSNDLEENEEERLSSGSIEGALGDLEEV